MNRMMWLIRREIWEHRAIWIAPLVVIASLLLAAVAGNVLETNIHIGADGDEHGPGATSGLTGEDVADLASIRGPEDLHKLEKLEKLQEAHAKGELRTISAGEAIAMVPEEKRMGVLAIVYAGVSAAMFAVLGIIGFFYALDALYADRKDRSVLFWKSLPLSDTETVLSKFAVAAVVIPLVAAAAAVMAQLIVAVGGSVKLGLTGGDVGVMWMPQVLGGGAVTVVTLAVVCALWYAPLCAYLLLASAWAPKSPILWASLPPVALIILEKIAFNSDYVSRLVNYRMSAPFEAMFRDTGGDEAAVRSMDIVGNITGLLVSPGTLLGLVAAAGLLAGTIWIRRYRDESTA